MIQGLLINKLIDILLKRFKLNKLKNYVEKPNELDIKVEKLDKQMKKVNKKLGIK